MTTRDLLQLKTWASLQAAEPGNPTGERRLWRLVAREVEAYERGTVLTTPSGAALCGICMEANGRHRSLASGRFISEHKRDEGLLW